MRISRTETSFARLVVAESTCLAVSVASVPGGGGGGSVCRTSGFCVGISLCQLYGDFQGTIGENWGPHGGEEGFEGEADSGGKVEVR